MSTIIIILTNHQTNGKCNSGELYSIIESINPQVIFEELPTKLFKIVYDNNITLPTQMELPPEIECIKQYRKQHSIKQVPVDIEVETTHMQKGIKLMDGVLNRDKRYRKLINGYVTNLKQRGYSYLNSKTGHNFFFKKINLRKEILTSLKNNTKLLSTLNKMDTDNDFRENEMISNIYKYSQFNEFDKAVILIGAEHCKSFFDKATTYEKQSDLNLEWRFFVPD